jgi:hypothetical protein
MQGMGPKGAEALSKALGIGGLRLRSLSLGNNPALGNAGEREELVEGDLSPRSVHYAGNLVLALPYQA